MPRSGGHDVGVPLDHRDLQRLRHPLHSHHASPQMLRDTGWKGGRRPIVGVCWGHLTGQPICRRSRDFLESSALQARSSRLARALAAASHLGSKGLQTRKRGTSVQSCILQTIRVCVPVTQGLRRTFSSSSKADSFLEMQGFTASDRSRCKNLRSCLPGRFQNL